MQDLRHCLLGTSIAFENLNPGTYHNKVGNCAYYCILLNSKSTGLKSKFGLIYSLFTHSSYTQLGGSFEALAG